MAEEHRALDGYQEFVEPSQLTLDPRNLRDSQSHPRDTLLHQEPDTTDSVTIQDPLARPYADLESTGYLSPGPLTDTLDLSVRGGSRSPFLWSGDYGPDMMDPCPDFPPLPLDDWSARLEERPDLGYEASSLPPFGFSGPFPGVGEMLGHPPNFHSSGSILPPLHSFAPLSPFSYGSNSMDMFQPPSRTLHFGQLDQDGGSQLPLLPALGNYLHDYEEHRTFQDPPPPPAEAASKKARVDKRNTKPLTIEDLLHDNSRFAKVVKAFLSIEDQENRTVPEIAKRVSEMYTGQYADFEGVKRMVNDVLQKHKAFWHPGRGSPYQLNLNEGRARREFPSNNRRLVRNRYDENLFYPRSKKQKKARQSVKKLQDPVVENDSDAQFLQGTAPREEGEFVQMFENVEIMSREDSPEHGEIELGYADDIDGPNFGNIDSMKRPPSSGRLRTLELNTLVHADT